MCVVWTTSIITSYCLFYESPFEKLSCLCAEPSRFIKKCQLGAFSVWTKTFFLIQYRSKNNKYCYGSKLWNEPKNEQRSSSIKEESRSVYKLTSLSFVALETWTHPWWVILYMNLKCLPSFAMGLMEVRLMAVRWLQTTRDDTCSILLGGDHFWHSAPRRLL